MKSVKAFREIVLFVIGLGIVGLVTAAIIATLHGSVSSKTQITTTSNPTIPAEKASTEVPYPYPAQAYSLTPDLDATQTAVQYIIQFSTEHPATLAPTVYETPKPTGTVESDAYLIASGGKLGVFTQNAWVGLLDGNEVDVYAGASLDDQQQGVVRIIVSVFRGGISELIKTPTKHGAVRVVSEHHNILTLVSADGTTYYFSVPARRFIASPSEVVPRATLPATKALLPPPPTLGGPTPVPPAYNPYPAPTGQSTAAP